MQLTHENYFSNTSNLYYMSSSQFKAFEQCEAKALAELKGEYTTNKDAYKEGHYFEACISGNDEIFVLQNPDMFSSRGASKGDIKSNFKKVAGSVEAFRRQPMFMDIIKDCQLQVIFTGEIAGLPFKGCVDFFKPVEYTGYDTKCMKDFKKVFSSVEKMHINWYFAYGYHYQAAIYRELIRQKFGTSGQQYILAVSKEEHPDVTALYFSEDILENALEIIKEYAPRYDKIKKGLIVPQSCGVCDYCKQTKVINDFEMVGEFE